LAQHSAKFVAASHQKKWEAVKVDFDFDPTDDWLDFDDLKRLKILKSRQQLSQWQKDPRINFPLGRLFGPNSRRWSRKYEIAPWVEGRPTERAEFESTT
jgi:hypothetical protein